MHILQLNVTNKAYHHLTYLLSNLSDDIEILSDTVVKKSSKSKEDKFEKELLLRDKELKNGKATILSREEVFSDI